MLNGSLASFLDYLCSFMGFGHFFVQTHNGFLLYGKTRQSDFPEYPPLSGLTYLSELSNYEDSNWDELTVLVTCNKSIFDCFSKKNLYNDFFEEEEFQKLKDQANETCAFLVNQSR